LSIGSLQVLLEKAQPSGTFVRWLPFGGPSDVFYHLLCCYCYCRVGRLSLLQLCRCLDHFVSANSSFVLSFWLKSCQINSHSDSFNLLSLLLLLEPLSFARCPWCLTRQSAFALASLLRLSYRPIAYRFPQPIRLLHDPPIRIIARPVLITWIVCYCFRTVAAPSGSLRLGALFTLGNSNRVSFAEALRPLIYRFFPVASFPLRSCPFQSFSSGCCLSRRRYLSLVSRLRLHTVTAPSGSLRPEC